MAEAIAILSLVNNIVNFIDITVRVIDRLKEFDESSSNFAKSLKDVKAQLPLLVEITKDINADCQRRRDDDQANATSRRDQQLAAAIAGLQRQVESLEDCLVSWAPTSTAPWYVKVRRVSQSMRKDKEILAIEKRIETYKSLLILNFSIPTGCPAPSDRQGQASYNVVPRHVSHFVGRITVLDQLGSMFQLRSPDYQRKIVVLHGMGGQGKTQTALQYCRAFLDSYGHGKVVWLDAMSPESVLRSFEKVHDLMGISTHQATDQRLKRSAVLRSITTWDSPWLLVFDNYDKPNVFGNIAENFPGGHKGAILFTSRTMQAGARLGHAIELGAMSLEEGIDLLIHRSGLERSAGTLQEGEAIVERLGRLPLAIDQAAAYMRARKLPLKDFWHHFDSRRQHVLSHTPAGDWEYRKSLTDSEAEHSLSVFTTWELSLSQFDAGSLATRSIQSFLTFASFLDSATISETLFASLSKAIDDTDKTTDTAHWLHIFKSNDVWDPFAFQDVVAQCYDLSLIQSFNMSGTHTMFRLHPLIADWLRLRVDAESRWVVFRDVASTLARYVDLCQDASRTLPNRNPFHPDERAEFMSYIDDCLRHERSLRDPRLQHLLGPRCLQSFASVLWSVDRWHDALDLTLEALNRCDLVSGVDGVEDATVVRVLQDLADIQSQPDQLDSAETNLNRILTAFPKVMASNSLACLQAQYGLGLIHRRRGDFKLALEVLRSCIREAESMKIEPKLTVDWRSNLGYILSRTSALQEAEHLLRSAIQICLDNGLRTYLEHIWPVNWLVRLLCLQGRFQEAETIWRQEYAAVLDRHGSEGWETVFLDELHAIILWKKGDLESAKAKLELCKDQFMKMYNAFDVEELLETTQFLGQIALAQNRVPEAKKLLIDAAAGWERMCGVGTSHVLEALGSYIEVLVREADADTATLEQTIVRVQLALDNCVDDKVPFVLHVSMQLGRAYCYMGDDGKGQQWINAAVTGLNEVLGSTVG